MKYFAYVLFIPLSAIISMTIIVGTIAIFAGFDYYTMIQDIATAVWTVILMIVNLILATSYDPLDKWFKED